MAPITTHNWLLWKEQVYTPKSSLNSIYKLTSGKKKNAWGLRFYKIQLQLVTSESSIVIDILSLTVTNTALTRICLQHRRPRFDSWVRKIHWRRDNLPTPVFLGFPGGSAGKESACHVGDVGLIPGLGGSHGEGKGYPLQYSGLENPIQFMGFQRVGHHWATFTHHYIIRNFFKVFYFLLFILQ